MLLERRKLIFKSLLEKSILLFCQTYGFNYEIIFNLGILSASGVAHFLNNSLKGVKEIKMEWFGYSFYLAAVGSLLVIVTAFITFIWSCVHGFPMSVCPGESYGSPR